MMIPRKEVYHTIRDAMGLQTLDVLAEQEKWQDISSTCKVELLVKERATTRSDYDVWLIDPGASDQDKANVKALFDKYWPIEYHDRLDLMLAPKTIIDAAPFNFTVYKPV
jgi:hypothetical protein